MGAEATKTDTNPGAATPPAIDAAAIEKAVASAVAAAIKPLTESLSQLGDKIGTQAASEPPKSGEKDVPAALTAADVTKIVTDAFAARDKAAEGTARVTAAVKAAAEKHLAGVPAVYASLLPQTDDAAALEAQATRIREQWQTDLAAHGVKAPNVGAQPGGGATKPGEAIDASTLSPVDKIATGFANKS